MKFLVGLLAAIPLASGVPQYSIAQTTLNAAQSEEHDHPHARPERRCPPLLPRAPATTFAMRRRQYEASYRALDMQVSSLRRELGDDPGRPRFIHTVHCAGYMLVDPVQP